MNIIYIIAGFILEILWIIGIIQCIKDPENCSDWKGYLTVITITNIITVIVVLKYFI